MHVVWISAGNQPARGVPSNYWRGEAAALPNCRCKREGSWVILVAAYRWHGASHER